MDSDTRLASNPFEWWNFKIISHMRSETEPIMHYLVDGPGRYFVKEEFQIVL